MCNRACQCTCLAKWGTSLWVLHVCSKFQAGAASRPPVKWVSRPRIQSRVLGRLSSHASTWRIHMCVPVNLESAVSVPAPVTFCLYLLERRSRPRLCVCVLHEACVYVLLKAAHVSLNTCSAFPLVGPAKGKAAAAFSTWAETLGPQALGWAPAAWQERHWARAAGGGGHTRHPSPPLTFISRAVIFQ